MSSASLPNKRSSKVPHIDSTSSITSAPTSTAASRLKARTTNRMKEQHQPKQRSSNLLDKSPNRRVRASNYELSSSDANENEAHKNRLRKTKSSTMGCSATDLQTNEPTVKKSNPVLDDMQQELSEVSKMRVQSENDLKELKRKYQEFKLKVENERQNPSSEYDNLIEKQQHFNESMENQISEAKAKLKNLTQSLKTIRICGKECDIHMRDLIIDYDCITKGELAKEIKRFQRMEIDLKNTLDRLHWRMDCETKMYQNFIDQFHKLQMDLYYLKNC